MSKEVIFRWMGDIVENCSVENDGCCGYVNALREENERLRADYKAMQEQMLDELKDARAEMRELMVENQRLKNRLEDA